MNRAAFLRIPPFPGHRAQQLAVHDAKHGREASTAAELIEQLRSNNVGGNFWSARPNLPEGQTLILIPDNPGQACDMIDRAKSLGLVHRCAVIAGSLDRVDGVPASLPKLVGQFDPWHLARIADEIWAGADQEAAMVAALTGRKLTVFGQGPFEQCGDGAEGLEQAVSANLLAGWHYRCPFSGNSISVSQAVELLAGWRQLIDGNREICSIYGVASWKRPTLDGLLWDGSSAARYGRRFREDQLTGSRIAAWKSRTPLDLLTQLERSGLEIAEIEDGMIRGPGLGANCVPPLSIVVDYSGIYFDPSQASDLEKLLETHHFDEALIGRAARLRTLINSSGISKYGCRFEEVRRDSTKQRILVVGQVEDDRSILSGGAGQTNLELLTRARKLEPDAWLIYRPHPDVEAGHRKGHVRDEVALRLADEIDRSSSVISLIEAVDGIHCITSLAGFEALLRGIPVTTHGVPFYAGWGLTNDLAEIPQRRTRRRSLDELVAATLILYPRYLDPVTRLPCTPEVLVDRVAKGDGKMPAPLSSLRVVQGKINLALRRLKEVAR